MKSDLPTKRKNHFLYNGAFNLLRKMHENGRKTPILGYFATNFVHFREIFRQKGAMISRFNIFILTLLSVRS